MNKSHLLALAFMAIAITGCSEDPLSKPRAEFLAGCSREVPMAICECAFDDIADKYSPEEITAISRGTRDDRLQAISQDTLIAMYECRNAT